MIDCKTVGRSRMSSGWCHIAANLTDSIIPQTAINRVNRMIITRKSQSGNDTFVGNEPALPIGIAEAELIVLPERRWCRHAQGHWC